ncbi:hypothetical protein ILUMI_09737, partial [Ignelater luminosus]
TGGKCINPPLSGTTFPIILFVDGHSTLQTLKISQLCTELEIILIALYPNATRLMQPANVAALIPLKTGRKKAVLEFRRKNPQQVLTKERFAPVLNTVVKKSLETNGATNSTSDIEIENTNIIFEENTADTKIENIDIIFEENVSNVQSKDPSTTDTTTNKKENQEKSSLSDYIVWPKIFETKGKKQIKRLPFVLTSSNWKKLQIEKLELKKQEQERKETEKPKDERTMKSMEKKRALKEEKELNEKTAKEKSKFQIKRSKIFTNIADRHEHQVDNFSSLQPSVSG